MRRDLIMLAVIVAFAFSVRVSRSYEAVFAGPYVNFLETDAWYHIRLVENQVRNYPWRVTMDPYAAPGGQFVAIAPLFDALTSTVVVFLHGRDAQTADVERIAAFIPPVLGAVAVAVVWALAFALFGRLAALFAALLLAILPGHFMDRTMLGFVDHHALEVVLALGTMLALVRSVTVPSVARQLTAGILLGLYLLAWSSGALLLAIIGVWFVLLILLSPANPTAAAPDATSRDVLSAARSIAAAALIALALVLAFQDPRMHRYGSQIVGLIGLVAVAAPSALLAKRDVRRLRTVAIVAAVAALALAGLAAWIFAPGVIPQIAIDLNRFVPDASRMNVLEARPLFLYPGEWNWLQPWEFFRAGFYVGLVALIAFVGRIWRERRPADLLVWVYAVAMFAATIGQNRFGYYLVTACALLGGWFAVRILEWGEALRRGEAAFIRVQLPLARELATVIVVGALIAPHVSRSALFAKRGGTLADHWQDVMMWLRSRTPPPFLKANMTGDEYFLSRYPRENVPRPDYAVMNWWDQGYWLVQRARRVPVSNPTQERAINAARFYVETDEVRALEIAREENSRFILCDWELPFRLTPDDVVMGRFQSVVDWAGGRHATYYEVYYRREGDSWIPVWVFHAPYYQTMVYRLMVMGGAPANPANATTVVTVTDRTDVSGTTFREILTQNTYATYEAALQAVAASRNPQALIVGLDPWQPAFPVPGLTSFVQRYAARTPELKPTEAPWVRIYETR